MLAAAMAIAARRTEAGAGAGRADAIPDMVRGAMAALSAAFSAVPGGTEAAVLADVTAAVAPGSIAQLPGRAAMVMLRLQFRPLG